VINADTTLKLPDFRAAERTYDLLEQVAGRAGRGERPGRVIVQTYWAGHPAIQAVLRHDRSLFLESELEERREAAYPPYGRLANVVASGRDGRAVSLALGDLAADLRVRVAGRAGWEVMGPADCLKARAKDRVRRHLMLKAPAEADLGVLLGEAVRALGRRPGVSVAVDVDCHDLM
jgi:primosomal protein N' (replication factor Y)